MSHRADEGARRRLGEAVTALQWARMKYRQVPSVETKRGLEKAVAEWGRAHTALVNAAATFGTSEDKEKPDRETLPECTSR
jgi:hypothetical protein